MDLYLNNVRVATLEVSPDHTIGKIKSVLKEWLKSEGYTFYKTRMIFNDGSELSPVIFTTDMYDPVNLTDHKDIIKGGSIRITAPLIRKTTEIKLSPCKIPGPNSPSCPGRMSYCCTSGACRLEKSECRNYGTNTAPSKTVTLKKAPSIPSEYEMEDASRNLQY